MAEIRLQLIDDVVDEFRARFAARVAHLDDATLRDLLSRVDQVAADSAEWAVGAIDSADRSLVARRIGPVYRTDQVAEYLTAPAAAPLTGEAVRKRVKSRQLVAFQTDDRHWAFPEFQFDKIGGRLVPRTEVIRVWGQLPHDGFMTAADLAAWLNTRFAALDGTPAEHAHRAGAQSPPLVDAIGRLVARAA